VTFAGSWLLEVSHIMRYTNRRIYFTLLHTIEGKFSYLSVVSFEDS